ncbi:histamine N-methyltransferase A-like [Ptychodera flava]|uniref:histamine N-methyltransferase A-like n=1 Tax=Ptychodera flava TaxID=63121 RepID=UPI00396A4734
MEGEIKFLLDHDKEYFERLNLVIANGFDTVHAQEFENYKNILKKGNFNKDSVLKVLAIGTGDGQAEGLFCDAALSMGYTLHHTAVEQSEAEINKFKTLDETKKAEGHWRNVTFDFHHITVQQYLRDARHNGEQQHFDVIRCPECAYFFTDAGDIFVELYKMLNKGGMLWNNMTGGAAEQITKELARHSPVTLSLYGSSTLREILGERLPGVDLQVETLNYNIECEECFKEDSRDGNMILDFFTQILDFRKYASKEVVDSILVVMDKNSCRLANGKRALVDCQEHVIILKK